MNELILLFTPIIIGGLFTWAYKHPTSYNKYTGYILLIVLFGCFCILIHVETKRTILNEFLYNATNKDLIKLRLKSIENTSNYLFPATLILLAIIYLLKRLRTVLTEEPKH